MSHAGIVDVKASNPDIPINFITESGTVTAAGNTIYVLGAGVASTAGAGDTITITSVGGGDVVGPASAVSGNIAVFDGVTGKLIADGGVSVNNIVLSDDYTKVFLLGGM